MYSTRLQCYAHTGLVVKSRGCSSWTTVLPNGKIQGAARMDWVYAGLSLADGIGRVFSWVGLYFEANQTRRALFIQQAHDACRVSTVSRGNNLGWSRAPNKHERRARRGTRTPPRLFHDPTLPEAVLGSTSDDTAYIQYTV